MRKLLLLCIIAFYQLYSYSAILVDGINYSIISDNELRVWRLPEGHYKGDIVIPSHVTYNDKTYTVTEVQMFAFNDCTELTSIELPNTITKLPNQVFSRCTNLVKVKLPDTLIEIPSATFIQCSSLRSIYVPKSVMNIEAGSCFNFCYGLEEIIVDSDNECYKDIDGVLYDKNETRLLKYPSAKSMNSYKIKESVTVIGIGAFASCESLESVVIPESITQIEDEAFVECKNLKNIESFIKVPFLISKNVFNEVNKETAILNVLKGTKKLYAATNYWNQFKNIIEVSSSDIELVNNYKDEIINSYFLNGMRANIEMKGIKIVKTKNGQTYKFLKH